MPDLPVGNYQVRVENAGFKTHVADNVVVAAGATVRLDMAMELGAAQQTVEVAVQCAWCCNRHGPRVHGGFQQAGGRFADHREWRGAQPLRSGIHHARKRPAPGTPTCGSAEAGLAFSA